MRYLQDRVLVRHGPHRDWNYTVLPAPRPAPEPEPGPGPGRAGARSRLVRALAALAGIGDPDALAARLALGLGRRREHRLALERGRARISRRGNSNASLARLALPAIITAAACRYTAGMSCALISGLLGVDPSTISDATRHAAPSWNSTAWPSPPADPAYPPSATCANTPQQQESPSSALRPPTPPEPQANLP